MLHFKYAAVDPTGKKFTGRIEASDTSTATQLLRERGLVVIGLQIEGDGLRSLLAPFQKHVSLGDISAFTRQFATMVTAGVTITESLSILRTQVSPGLAPIIDQVLADVESGSSLTVALEKHPEFTPVYIALVKAGETAGILDQVLLRLADNIEKEREFRGKVVTALIYPIIIVIAMIIVGFIVMVFVIPKLTQIYQEFGVELPLTTKVIIAISSFMSTFWWLFILLAVLAFWGFAFFRRLPSGKALIDRLLLRIPVFGGLLRQIMLTEFTRTLGLLIGAGVSILESLHVVAKVADNSVITTAVEQAAKDVEKGFPLAWALGQRSDAVPPIVARMIAVGEETGKVDEVLSKISTIMETESEMKVRTLTSTIEPLLMIVLGIGVGIMVFSVLLPIFSLAGKFQ